MDEFTSWKYFINYVFKFLGKYKKKFIFWYVLLIIAFVSDLFLPIIAGQIIDFFTNYRTGDSLQPFYLFVGYTFAIMAGFSIIRLESKKRIAKIFINVRHDIQVKGFEKLMNFSMDWHKKESTGNKVTRLERGVSYFKVLQNMANNTLTPALVGFVGILIVFMAISFNYFIFFLIYGFIFWFVEIYYTKRVAKKQLEMEKVHEKATGLLFESANNLVSIKALGAKNQMQNKANKQWEKRNKLRHERQELSNAKWKWFQIVNSIAMVFFLLMMGFDFIAGSITVGYIIVFYTYMARMRSSMADSTKIMSQLVEAKQGISRMLPLFEQEAEVWFGTKKFPKKWSVIRFEDISFEYEIENRSFKIKDVNLNIKKNEKIGVVGRSGSGKSTIVKLLIGLYKLNQGNIFFDSLELYDLQHKELTKNVSIVLQDAELFNMSFKDNITLLKKFDQKQFNLAIEIAQLKPILKKLPQGIQTILGEKGYKLSGGERQRIGIARAIYKNPQILILDEATSSLDTQTEKKIQHQLETKLKNKTIITIAHRLSTLTGVDRIVVFKNGKIVEEGKYSTLSRNKSIFKSMLEQQNK